MKKRGSKQGVKRGAYNKRKPRRYATRHKTTTREGKREYQRRYMRDYMRRKNSIPPARFGIRGRRPKIVLLKDIKKDLRRLTNPDLRTMAKGKAHRMLGIASNPDLRTMAKRKKRRER